MKRIMFELEDRHETMPISFNANEIFLSEKYLKKKNNITLPNHDFELKKINKRRECFKDRNVRFDSLQMKRPSGEIIVARVGHSRNRDTPPLKRGFEQPPR